MPSKPKPNYITTEEFIDMTNMELVQLFMLLEDNKLPITRINHHLHIDINDERAKYGCWKIKRTCFDAFELWLPWLPIRASTSRAYPLRVRQI
jgi:hypothetical protein